ncbi:alpha/beta hydrolase [Naasia aerilata]|uniref:Esterase n=1 Tax=Naasia aerilata TaxID=1162966 RepID=A0ABN6XN58_9MICO|nr:alpha/beta fold hydrolase [Naasia aerilata]BDZ46311.1 hypothetical protein GCM10025866_22200 [Naasia aerilata]
MYEPPGLREVDRPLLVLLHGRGGTHDEWHPLLDLVDALADPPVVLMPDAPWLGGASFYVDSLYAGNGTGESGRPVETALAELIAATPELLRVSGRRDRRTIGGISMGGAGALRLALAHPELAASALALSPAVFVPEPPMESSIPAGGGYGLGTSLFDRRRYTDLSYPAALAAYPAHLPLKLFVASGDSEPAGPGRDGRALSLTDEGRALAEAAATTPGIEVEHRVFAGGHDWGCGARPSPPASPGSPPADRINSDKSHRSPVAVCPK